MTFTDTGSHNWEPRSSHDHANARFRRCPMGVRRVLAQVAFDGLALDDMPTWAIDYLVRTGALEPAKKKGHTWRTTKHYHDLITRIKDRYRY